MRLFTPFLLTTLVAYSGGAEFAAEAESVANSLGDYDLGGYASDCDKLTESQRYKYPTCPHLVGPSPGDRLNRRYVYAVPCRQINGANKDLYDVDKVWGGAHVTLGTVDKQQSATAVRDFNTLLEKYLSDPKLFDTTKTWNPGHKGIKSAVYKDCGLPKKIYGYKMVLNSHTLNRIVAHLSSTLPGTNEKKFSWFAPEPELHITTVASGHLKVEPPSPEPLKKVVTQHVPWVLALVEVTKDTDNGTISLTRLKQGNIYNLQK
jgi:hypothetical protein